MVSTSTRTTICTQAHANTQAPKHIHLCVHTCATNTQLCALIHVRLQNMTMMWKKNTGPWDPVTRQPLQRSQIVKNVRTNPSHTSAVHTRVRAHTHKHKHTYTHTHTHTHTHTRTHTRLTQYVFFFFCFLFCTVLLSVMVVSLPSFDCDRLCTWGTASDVCDSLFLVTQHALLSVIDDYLKQNPWAYGS
jgi:hypothetical protein